MLNGIFKRAMKVYGLPANPMILVERPRVRHSSEIEVFSTAEVRALARAASSELYGTVFLTAAFTGLRMGELRALCWGEVDFAAETIRVVRGVTVGGESSPKSGKAHSVPMVQEVATALARLSQRERFTADGDLVFAGAAGGHLDSKDVRSAYKAALDSAGLRRLRFHDLRHTFGTRAVEKAESIPRAQGVDGPRQRADHDALPALQVQGRRRTAAGGVLRGGNHGIQRANECLSARTRDGVAHLEASPSQSKAPGA